MADPLEPREFLYTLEQRFSSRRPVKFLYGSQQSKKDINQAIEHWKLYCRANLSNKVTDEERGVYFQMRVWGGGVILASAMDRPGSWESTAVVIARGSGADVTGHTVAFRGRGDFSTDSSVLGSSAHAEGVKNVIKSDRQFANKKIYYASAIWHGEGNTGFQMVVGAHRRPPDTLAAFFMTITPIKGEPFGFGIPLHFVDQASQFPNE